MDLYLMSKNELDRLDLIRRLETKELSVVVVADLLGLSRSQVHRLVTAYKHNGANGLISKRRNRPSNRTLPSAMRELSLALIREHYADFGPTLAAEKLREHHELTISKETIRQWMIADGLWMTKAARRRIYQPRNRRDCLGDLVQIDGSMHPWFEDRAGKCSLLVFIDDATSRIMHLRFCPSESTFDYMAAMKAYVSAHGKPTAFYSDKHTIFRTPRPATKSTGDQEGRTQFGRALHEMNIDIICANTPQAKGRVERSNRTLQDRLVKELRLAGISTMEEANAFAPTFIADHNSRFAKPPKNPKNAHRPLAPHDDLDGASCIKNQRTISASLTVLYNRVIFILEKSEATEGLARKHVTVCDYPDGRLEIRHKGRELNYRTFDKIRRVNRSEIVENKRLGAVLSAISEQQTLQEIKRPGPRRRGQGPNMFKLDAKEITT